MADFNLYFSIENNLEGVVYETPNGNPTKFGLQVSDVSEYYGYTCVANDVKNMTASEAALILKKLYWDYFQGDNITNQLLAEFIVDSGLLNGKQFIAIAIQELIGGLVADGLIGTKSIAAINSYSVIDLYNRLYGYRYHRFDQLKATYTQDYAGWINRLNAIKVE